jgi:hypothetical protein
MFSRRHFHGCRMFSMQQATGQIQAAFQLNWVTIAPKPWRTRASTISL